MHDPAADIRIVFAPSPARGRYSRLGGQLDPYITPVSQAALASPTGRVPPRLISAPGSTFKNSVAARRRHSYAAAIFRSVFITRVAASLVIRDPFLPAVRFSSRSVVQHLVGCPGPCNGTSGQRTSVRPARRARCDKYHPDRHLCASCDMLRIKWENTKPDL